MIKHKANDYQSISRLLNHIITSVVNTAQAHVGTNKLGTDLRIEILTVNTCIFHPFLREIV